MVSATKGTIVHRGLELLLGRKSQDRTRDKAHQDLDCAFEEYSTHPDLVDLHLSANELTELTRDSHDLVDKYFLIENPQEISPIGLELKLEATVGDTKLRGVIDRLELDDSGDLVVTDYKTGSVPRASSEHSKLMGVQVYALLCAKVFGKLPSKIQLLYLTGPTVITAVPSESSIRGVGMKSNAIAKAVSQACEKGDFRANVSPLCDWCGYRELCPAQGGHLP